MKIADRPAVARERAKTAWRSLSDCHLCAHHCGINRFEGNQGFCRAGVEARVFSAQIEVSDELELIPTFAIALSGCDMRCGFCITGAQSWNPRAGEVLDPITLATLAQKATTALADGAHSIMILGGEPTIHLPTALEIVATLPENAKLIWKTNAHGSNQALVFLDGLFDIWIADYKFGNNGCAERLAKIPCYEKVVQENLFWAYHHSELIVRHLVMPGHIDCCWEPVAQWLASNLPGVKTNLRTGFWPAWHATRYPELCETVSDKESERAFKIAHDYDLNLIL